MAATDKNLFSSKKLGEKMSLHQNFSNGVAKSFHIHTIYLVYLENALIGKNEQNTPIKDLTFFCFLHERQPIQHQKR
ncbi:hypothetical protein, partial [Geobacillus thermodenitrificans]|uniref:hypothetical protein n=1 Tax=Geobacillus thermodenitrificans TaxID=33940 RepID=UPI002E21FE56|nr:hypothetical protein [Geobacillus thermodenitrificans]